MKTGQYNKKIIYPFFLIYPLLINIIGIFYFRFPLSENVNHVLLFPLFFSLILLFIGYLFDVFYKKNSIGANVKIIGWLIHAFYWSTQINTLYYGEDGDIVNAFICFMGVIVLSYIGYHEFLSKEENKKISCLNWVAGAAGIAGLIYFGIERTPIAPWLIETVAMQSAMLLNVFTGNTTVEGVHILSDGRYAVSIIFACTGIQSMVLFVGMIIPLPKASIRNKIYAFLVSVVPIYFLNLGRNAMIAYLMSENITSFFIAHNIIGKGGSLIALVIILFIVIKIIPELFDEIICIIDLHKRNGPIEKIIKKLIGSKKTK